jgi:1,4-dihydroxy-2-naphthoyl-CoA hydrolase
VRLVARPPTSGAGIAAGRLDELLGFELLESSADSCRARFAVEDRVRQPFGLVHGGAYAALAETMVSLATHTAVSQNGDFAVGQSNHTSFLRPVTDGSILAEGRPRHRGRTTWVWDVDFTDDDGRLCATARVTMAVRPAPNGA